jgi:hypothetical protein
MNLNLDAFTYITGVVGLLAFVLQVLDKFPEHRELRKNFFLIVLGIFVGSTVAALKSTKFDFGGAVPPFDILVGVVLAVLIFVSITAAFVKVDIRRRELFGFAGACTVVLFLLFIGKGISTLDSGDEVERKRITFEELVELSDIATAHQSYERALLLLEEAKSRLPANDDRRKNLDGRESEIKKKQIGG